MVEGWRKLADKLWAALHYIRWRRSGPAGWGSRAASSPVGLAREEMFALNLRKPCCQRITWRSHGRFAPGLPVQRVSDQGYRPTLGSVARLGTPLATGQRRYDLPQQINQCRDSN